MVPRWYGTSGTQLSGNTAIVVHDLDGTERLVCAAVYLPSVVVILLFAGYKYEGRYLSQ